jgi:hypothetical protein
MHAVLTRWIHEVAPKFVLALSATLLAAACATEPAATTADAAAPAAQAAAPAANAVAANATGEPELECRNETVTGSAFKRRVCMTREEWRATQRGQRRVIEEASRRSREAAGVGAAASQGVPQGPTSATFP